MSMSNDLSHVRLMPHDDHPTLNLAAEELTRFLAQSAGSAVTNEGGCPLQLVVDPSLEGYRVQAGPEGLTFTGQGPVEVLYSVYHFAEQELGFCFFEPGVERVEKRGAAALPLGTVLEQGPPLLRNRGLIQEFPPSPESYALADWMARNRLNYLLIWMKFYDQFTDDLKAHFRDRGIRVEPGHHNFDYYIPMARYRESHPEYFAFRDGRRVAYDASDTAFLHSKQLCVTNPGLRDELVKSMARYVEQNPEVEILSLVPNDGFGWCECESCQRFYRPDARGDFHTIASHVYPAQDLYHDLIRDIAGRLSRELPQVRLSLVAYVNYVDPADGFVLNSNQTVHLAPYWRCINHRLDDPACPINRRYMESIDRWDAARRGGTINLYEYYMGVRMYVSLPMVHHVRIFDELPSLARHGVDGVLTQFDLDHWTAYGMNYYLMAKAAYGEGPAAVATALGRLFGDDRAEAEQFWAALRELQDSAGPCHIPIPRFLFNRTDVDQYERLVDQAERLASRKPDDAYRQALVSWMRYLLRFKQVFNRYRAGEDVRPELDAFQAWAEGLRGQRVYVARSLAALLKAWRTAIDRGQPWYHFNIDWEDGYIRAYDERWAQPAPATETGGAAGSPAHPAPARVPSR